MLNRLFLLVCAAAVVGCSSAPEPVHANGPSSIEAARDVLAESENRAHPDFVPDSEPNRDQAEAL